MLPVARRQGSLFTQSVLDNIFVQYKIVGGKMSQSEHRLLLGNTSLYGKRENKMVLRFMILHNKNISIKTRGLQPSALRYYHLSNSVLNRIFVKIV